MSENVLTPKQKKGLAAILTQPTLTAAAQAAGVAGKTMDRWLKQPAFMAELKTKQAAVIDRASGRLIQELGKAIDTLANLAENAESESVRRQAAGELIDKCFAIRERTELEARLSELEKAVKI
jgi:hypothetical protein